MADFRSVLNRMDTEAHICETCGAQHAPSTSPPAECIICADERQFVPKSGQRWVTQGQVKKSGVMHNMWQKLEDGLYGITTSPKLGIGQRAFLIITPQGNFLWDCIAFLDDATIDIVKALGGLKGIAISHPHFYTSNAQWSAAFGGVPVYLHWKDKQWVTFEHENIVYWSGESLKLLEGLTVVKLGGHFAGACILHSASAANGKGAVLSGDIVQVAMNRQGVSVMRSFPNYLPLSASKAKQISDKISTLEYDRLYGAFFGLDIDTNAKSRVKQSLERYVHWSQDEDFDM
ncbi:unnamed protein product [Calypogeia fissa]